ncbi:MAG: CotH kinase family protein [Bacteroidales bacterium]
MRKLLGTALLGALVCPLFSQVHWESVVRAQDNWTYWNATGTPPASWYAPGFDDSGWTAAKGSFGYGDDDDSTLVTVPYSLYIRGTFQVPDVHLIDSLLLDIDYDDAFMAYLNGVPVARSYNVDTDYPPYNYTPSIDQEANLYRGLRPTRVSVAREALNEGENVLAIQGINNGNTSSDFSLAPYLQGRINSASLVYHDVPAWFKDPDEVFSSNLPLMVIDGANGQSIPDEPKIDAHLGVVHNESGINTYPGTYNNYDGLIGVERRGASSLGFPKTGYGFETRMENGDNNNVPLLDLPPENDWVLHGPYSDKSLIRNVLAYQFARDMGQYAPRTKLCELFVNQAYMGVYVLVEKVKRDTFRLDIGKLLSTEITGRDLTGGYILKIDKGEDLHWVSPYLSINQNDLRIQYYYPDPDSVAPEQMNYIRDYVTGFENALAGPRYRDPVQGYRPYVDLQSFVDFYLVNELTKNVDGYRISTYMHKDKDKKDRLSPLKAGPVWDFNLGFGNADYYDASRLDGWQNEHPGDYWSPPFWWARLKQDPTFFNLLVDSWTDYRSTILTDARVGEVIDSLVTLLDGAQQRNFEAFPILNTYVWPNNYVGNSYENEIAYLKNWILGRMAWMDGELDEYHTGTDESISVLQDLTLYPNPVRDVLHLQLQLQEAMTLQLEITNLMGQTSYSETLRLEAGSSLIRLEEGDVRLAMPEPGMYFVRLLRDGQILGTEKVIRE